MNNILYELCKMNIYFLSNDNICRNFICDDGAHLNKKGSYILASNSAPFNNSIFNFNWLSCESCLTENCNSKCLSGNNMNENTKLSNNSDSALYPLTNKIEETDEDTIRFSNKYKKENSDTSIVTQSILNLIKWNFYCKEKLIFLLWLKLNLISLFQSVPDLRLFETV